jgi:HAD domain in Swiss Army Knife RNA repair proteins
LHIELNKSTPKVPLVLFDLNLPAGELNFDHVLVIDFDGVFHPEGTPPVDEFQFVPGFCEVLRQFDPDGLIPIVVSSMWRFSETIEQLRSHFPDHVGRQIVGVTPDLTPAKPVHAINAWGDGTLAPLRGQRQRECERWMSDHAPAGNWLAIDDRDHLFEANCPHLFLIPDVYDDCGGLDEAQCKRLSARMSEFLTRQAPQKALGPK